MKLIIRLYTFGELYQVFKNLNGGFHRSSFSGAYIFYNEDREYF